MRYDGECNQTTQQEFIYICLARNKEKINNEKWQRTCRIVISFCKHVNKFSSLPTQRVLYFDSYMQFGTPFSLRAIQKFGLRNAKMMKKKTLKFPRFEVSHTHLSKDLIDKRLPQKTLILNTQNDIQINSIKLFVETSNATQISNFRIRKSGVRIKTDKKYQNNVWQLNNLLLIPSATARIISNNK